tara:strand:- start:685 stop:867 length:183 start_codon:yes stop_codon:yes gene_type:complete
MENTQVIPMKDIQWSAQILLPSNRLQKVEFVCESNLRQDAENKCKSLFGVTDVRQLKREW